MSLTLHERAGTGNNDGREPRRVGKVFLIGAGPGDPELITVKGLRILREADVVVYDRLICPDLLEEAPPEAKLVYVGKESGRHSMKQEEINTTLVNFAQLGFRVVRLKGGDPFIFGRGGEEALALFEAGIPFEIVPGISSALAVPAYAGIPVTHRNIASSVTIVTGHEQRNDTCSAPQWDVLAKVGGTLVILMGVETLSQITASLRKGGLDASTPAAVVQQGTIPQQRMVSGTLLNIAERAATASISSPAITIIGQVVTLSDFVQWFETLSQSESVYTNRAII